MDTTKCKSSRGLRNCNPGNIRRDDRGAPFQGEIKPSQDAAFRQFKSMAYGYRALLKTLQNYHKLHQINTIRGIVMRWAPPSENHTLDYIFAVEQGSGIDRDAILDFEDKSQLCSIAAAMSFVENGRDAVMDDVEEGWDLL
jgi:hypothetical protein